MQKALRSQFESSESALALNLQTFNLILRLEVSNCKPQRTLHHEYIVKALNPFFFIGDLHHSPPRITVEVIPEL